MLFSTKKSVLGVDIGTSSIKLVQVDKGSTPQLKTYGIVAIPEPISLQTSDATVEEIAQLLKNLAERANVTTKRCIASLPNGVVFTSVIDMPLMSEKELSASMTFEAKKYVPLPFSEIDLSWSVIVEDPAAAIMKVLLIAVPKQIKHTYVKVFELAGLELEIIDIEALALIRSLVTDPTKNDVIIDIGAKVTGINLVKNGLLQLTRSLNIGGDTMTDRIAQALNITFDRAERFKQDFGLKETEFLPEAVKPVLGTIKHEIAQLISIYKSHNVNLDRIVFTGGGAQMPGVTTFFEDLGVTPVLANSLSRVSYSVEAKPILERYTLLLGVPIGLALRNVET